MRLFSALVVASGLAWVGGRGIPNPTGLTVYHSAPPCAGPGVRDRDSGDVFGDIYFVVRSIMTPLECIPDPPHQARCGNHSCSNPEVFGSDLVITKVDLKVDGVVLRAAEGDLNSYSHCDITLTAAQCSYNCSSDGGRGTSTLGCWNISKLMAEDETCGQLNNRSLSTEWWSANLQDLLATPDRGFWFSTLAAGEGKTWQQVGDTASITKRCSDAVHFGAVESDGAACFGAAGAKTGAGRSIKDPGWIKCYYDTILGPESYRSYNTSGGWTANKIAAVWDDAFKTCPEVMTS